jgi:hypothetical protein
MAINFNKHEWITGQTITAQLLNRLENAIYELCQQDMTEATEAQADALCDSLFEDFLDDEV